MGVGDEHDVGDLSLGRGDSVLDGLDHGDLEAAHPEHAGERLPDDRVVVDDQHTGRAGHGAILRVRIRVL